MLARPAPSKFLAFHTIVAFAIASGMFALALTIWRRSLSLHPPHPLSLSQVLLTAIPMSAFIAFVYWYLAWCVSRHLTQLVPLKPEVPLADWQRKRVRRVTARMQLLWIGMFATLGAVAILMRLIFPDSGSSAPIFIVAFLMYPPIVVSFAYRQGLHDAQNCTATPPTE